MPASMAPKPQDNIITKDITPPGWERAGEKREHFTILKYIDPATLNAANDAARKTTVQNGARPAEERNVAAYYAALFGAQLKGWRLLVDPAIDLAAYKGRIEEEGGYLFWRFLPINVAELPWDIATWLDEQILQCGGGLATSALITQADDKTLLDFRGEAAGMVPGALPGSADPERN